MSQRMVLIASRQSEIACGCRESKGSDGLVGVSGGLMKRWRLGVY